VILALSRGIYFAATMLLFGDAAFGALLRARLPVITPLRLWPLRWAALLVAVLAACLWLGLAAAQMADAINAQVLIQTLTGTLFGELFLARLAALLAMALLLAFWHSAKLMVLPAAIALVLPAVTSHAALASPAGFTAIGTILDGVHLLTAGFWIGGLVVLVALLRRKSLFSDWAMIAVLLLVMTGLIDAAQVLLGGKGAVSSAYLAVLGAKLVLVAVMLCLAAANRFKWMPKGDDGAIGRNSMRELAAGIIVVLLAGALGQLQPLM